VYLVHRSGRRFRRRSEDRAVADGSRFGDSCLESDIASISLPWNALGVWLEDEFIAEDLGC
jgi:hypothetical protein